MSGLVRVEILKLRSTRTSWVMTLGALALITVAVAAASAASRFTPADQPARQTLALPGPAQTCALILGVLAVSSEFRHGTITPALLITPRRPPLLMAKLITLTASGVAFGLLAFAAAAAVALPILSVRRRKPDRRRHLARIIAGGAVATALFAALGVGIGAVLRNQAGAMIAALGLLYLLEPLLSLIPGIGHGVQRLGVAGLAGGASGTTGFPSGAHLLGHTPATLILGAYARRPNRRHQILPPTRHHRLTPNPAVHPVSDGQAPRPRSCRSLLGHPGIQLRRDRGQGQPDRGSRRADRPGIHRPHRADRTSTRITASHFGLSTRFAPRSAAQPTREAITAAQ